MSKHPSSDQVSSKPMSTQQPNQGSLIDRLAHSAMLRIAYEIESWVVQAKLDLHHPCNHEAKNRAWQRMKVETVLFVSHIEICGKVCRDMYDHAPGFAYFYTNGVRRIRTPQYCSLPHAMHLAEKAYADADACVDEEEEYDGLFSPTSAVLVDQFGGVVQEFKPGKGWTKEFPSAAEWEALMMRADELSSEAGVEAGWDNFSTAEGLREHAERLRRQVSMAMAQARLLR